MRRHSTRRGVLRSLGGAGLVALAGCTVQGSPDDPARSSTPRSTVSGPADATVDLTASTGTVRPGASDSDASRTWLYDGTFPGPELRVGEGDVLRVDVTNGLSEGTTIHWHGVPLPNRMDGVPGVTQEPIAPDSTFTYEFEADPAGTYFYHSHVGLQSDRGLLGPLIVEEGEPHVEYDREYTLVLDDYLVGEPEMPSGSDGTGMGGMSGSRTGGGGMGGMSGGGMGGGPNGSGMGGGAVGGMMRDRRPSYAGLLVNGRLPSDPPTLAVERGERVRLRFVNAASATTFRVRLAGHRLNVSHADGRPVDPVPVDEFVFGSGERYDAVVEADNPGAWQLRADAVSGTEPPARAVLRYDGSGGTPAPPRSGGRRLRYADLRAIEPLDGIDGTPDRTFDLTLSGGMGGMDGMGGAGGSDAWLIDGRAYPDAEPLTVREGEHVRVRMVNHSPVVHPMHLHGHFFRVGDAVKDTVRVPSRMGELTFDFVADNPGEWLFHCHTLYHLEAGMARVLRYG
ncbi:multicopper oxidase family protein [Halegenticoccus tardaugens]|uniref:multicopper oxidase family protein n=1 Tax=Halegenticoccus tardaugens TaxID=2071624 RepID=UPI001E401F7D|nr:multicopper oxidase family protein [Halegenticoccus tardaugens]